MQGFDPAIVNVEGGNDSDVVSGGMVSLPIALAAVELKKAIQSSGCEVCGKHIPPYERSKSKEQAQTPKPPRPSAWKEAHDEL